MVAELDHYYVPKKLVDYVLWNRLIGVDNPERVQQADERQVLSPSPEIFTAEEAEIAEAGSLILPVRERRRLPPCAATR
jgi:hypothetical protein